LVRRKGGMIIKRARGKRRSVEGKVFLLGRRRKKEKFETGGKAGHEKFYLLGGDEKTPIIKYGFHCYREKGGKVSKNLCEAFIKKGEWGDMQGIQIEMEREEGGVRRRGKKMLGGRCETSLQLYLMLGKGHSGIHKKEEKKSHNSQDNFAANKTREARVGKTTEGGGGGGD